MNYVYNATTKVYTGVSDFDATGVVKGDPIMVLLLVDLDIIFQLAKKRTAIRGRFATDQQGKALLEKIALTDDERDWYDEIIKNGGTEIFRKLSSWTKGIQSAYRHKVKFGNPLFAGKITAGGTTAVLTDSTKAFTASALIGKKLVITSPGAQMNKEVSITANAATTITFAAPFTSDVTDLDYIICDTTSDFALYYLNLDLSWDLNLFLGIGANIEEALALYTVKEWYKINRNTNDFPVEEAAYEDQISKIRSQLLQYKIPARRVTDFFQ